MLCLVAQLYPTVCDPMDCSPPGPSVHGDSPGKNTGVDCHALLQWIWGCVTDNSEYLGKEFRFTCGKAFELKFDVIQHVYFITMTKEAE